MGEVRKDVGDGRRVGRGKGYVGKYGEVLENVREVWESVLECGGGVGSVGKHGEMCLRCGKCVGVGRDEENCGQRWRVWEDVERG